MNIWKVLEINETKNKEDIQKAYREKLMKTHPEDDPEGFMELRRAFEEAMAAADAREPDPAETKSRWGDDPVGKWMEQVDRVYNSFSQRIDPKAWEKLLQDDVCMNLDTKITARSCLLTYFMEHFFISQKVMILLDEHFGFTENMDELVEEFPKNYLDVVITQGLEREEYPPYEYLRGDDSCDFDEYLKTGIKLSQCISACDTKKGFDLVQQMRDTGIESPFLDVDNAKLLCQESRFEEADLYMQELREEYPELDDVHLMSGDVKFFMEDYEAAEAEYDIVLEKDSGQEWAKQGKAKCLMKRGEFREANDIFSALLEDSPYDMDTAAWLKECNVQYIEHLKKEIETSDDLDPVMDLGWCYYQNEEYEQAIALMQYVEPDEKHMIEYESLQARCHLYADRFIKSMKHLQNWQKLLEELPDSDENREKKSYQLPFCMILQGYAWDKMGNHEKAMQATERAIRLDPNDPEPVIHMGQLLTKRWELEKAVECFTKAIELKPDSHAAYVMRARALFHMGYFSDAYSDCEKTLEIFPYELAAYVYKVKIFIEVGQFDRADEVIAFLESEKLSGNELQFLKGFVLEARGDKEAARSIYRDIVDNRSEDNDEIFNAHNLAEVYYHLAVLKYNTSGATYSQVEELVEEGLADSPDDVQLLEFKGELAYERKKYRKALSIFLKLEEIAPGRRGIYGTIDNIYRDLDKWDKALEYAEKQIDQAPTGYAYMRRGQLFAYLNRNEDAENDFKMAMRLAPELSYPYNYMGVLMESYDREDEALDYYITAIETGERENDICGEAYVNASGLYCRRRDFDASKDVLQRGYEHTGDISLLYEMIVTARRAGDFGEALELLKDYRNKNGAGRDLDKYALELANIYREMGDMEKAMELYKTLAKNSFNAGLEAGKICFYEGRYKVALKYMKNAIKLYEAEIGSDFLLAEYYMWAAKTALEGGFCREAEKLAVKGLQLIPSDHEQPDSCLPMLEQMQGGLHAILGNYEKARACLESALSARKCDYCTHGYCIDACYEMIYLCLMTGNRSEALEYLKKGIETDPIDTDFREIGKQIEMVKR